MRKPVYAICKQQMRRSACASAQSDQRLCCCMIYLVSISKPLTSFSVAAQAGLISVPDHCLSFYFESYI